MKIDRSPENVPIHNDEETTITLAGSEVSLIYDALTLLQNTFIKKAYNYTLSETFSNREFEFKLGLIKIHNVHALLEEFDKLFEIPF
ncbi:MAG: hypothetical protein K2N27_10280 [Ruminococcus sp.]|nr:hypothetical protein [Ruminococcus sp.]